MRKAGLRICPTAPGDDREERLREGLWDRYRGDCGIDQGGGGINQGGGGSSKGDDVCGLG